MNISLEWIRPVVINVGSIQADLPHILWTFLALFQSSHWVKIDTFGGSFLILQGCIFWPLSPPFRGGEKIGTFGSLGKKIDPSEKKKFEFYKQMFFPITTATLLRNT